MKNLSAVSADTLFPHPPRRLRVRHFADGRRRVAWLENWARRQRLFDETLPKDARGFVRLGFKRLELGEDNAAWEAFIEALKRDPAVAPLLKEHAQELLSEGRPLAASNLLENLTR